MVGSLIVQLGLIEINFIPSTRIRVNENEKNPIKVVKDNFVGVNLVRLPGRATEEQKIIFRKFFDFSSFFLKNHLRHFLIYTTIFLKCYKKEERRK